ncbi:MAG: prepilin-type N-terminal cleavage/methylation domain-containing protein [Candidatus Marinimicrobia bacterium]|jgi:prepilin-type N-terminal cleavage/methylation domain-containing protein|nr:prepilin-type N-terminal cleavage/methylation domain-containing protein [Candidatus Neomarinimicrobiota bacterium]MBT3937600.1 prepilin-type N-terminal cleavage/methylation domain-containing protein [Candidatus Neomarinimicrobiota bacterium]MBT3960693.1 prepilin-type N-terminal cleavage/methylation domain-containing protein [Candidatus Neomarinimicrobiota bacterium]MBT4382883.1 prepilin-type N-terminal cleavage/methylation domain-containing protein [Candidatus Neomarinimicrobiota bacterium]M
MIQTKKREAGFTMIEIMVVVVIVAILAAIAVPIYVEYVKSARASEARSVIGSISNSSDMFYQTNGEWPSSTEDLERQGQLDLKRSTKAKWQFELQLSDEGGQITATSSEEMAGGGGHQVIFNRETGKFTGYGSKGEE